MAFWNLTGFLGLFIGIGAGVLCSSLFAMFLGDPHIGKAIGFFGGGLAMIGMDLALRLRHDRSEGLKRLFLGEFGGTAVVPMWLFGLIGMAGGASLLLTPN